MEPKNFLENELNVDHPVNLYAATKKMNELIYYSSIIVIFMEYKN